MTIATARTWRTAFVEEPSRIAISQPHQVLLSGMSVTFTAAFFYDALSRLPFLPPGMAGAVAVAGAVGAEYAYLKGLADGAATKGKSAWEYGLIGTVCALLIVSGTLVTLRYAYPIEALTNPEPWMRVVLTLAHIVPLAALGLCSAMLHAEVEATHAATSAAMVAAAAERERAAQQQQAENDAAERERQQRRIAVQDAAEARLVDARAEAEADETRAMARLRLRAATAQVSRETVTATVTVPVTGTVTPRQDAEGRDVSRARVVALIQVSRDSGAALVVSQAWQKAGLSSRGMWYKLVAEAEKLGEL
ncbi:MAG: hypothetical protein WCG26_00985 [Chloroflexales bacterium]